MSTKAALLQPGYFLFQLGYPLGQGIQGFGTLYAAQMEEPHFRTETGGGAPLCFMKRFMEIVEKSVQIGSRQTGGIGAERIRLVSVLGKFRRLGIDLADHKISEMLQQIP